MSVQDHLTRLARLIDKNGLYKVPKKDEKGPRKPVWSSANPDAPMCLIANPVLGEVLSTEGQGAMREVMREMRNRVRAEQGLSPDDAVSLVSYAEEHSKAHVVRMLKGGA